MDEIFNLIQRKKKYNSMFIYNEKIYIAGDVYLHLCFELNEYIDSKKFTVKYFPIEDRKKMIMIPYGMESVFNYLYMKESF